MAITVLYVLAAIATVGSVLAAAVKAALKRRERHRHGPGPPQYDLTGKRVTWARRTGTMEQDSGWRVARLLTGLLRR